MSAVTPVGACAVVAVDPDKVAQAREALPGPEEAARLAQLFKLLGEPRRARLLYALRAAGELCVCDLAAVVDAPEAAVSQALRLLRTAGVVANRRDGRMVYYRLADEHVRLLLDLSREHNQHEGAH